MAHAHLGVLFTNREELDRARDHFELAWRERNRLSGFEALYVEAWTATVEPDPVRALNLWKSMVEEYPGQPAGLFNETALRCLAFGDCQGCGERMARVVELGAMGEGGLLWARLRRSACLQMVEERDQALEDARWVLEAENASTTLRLEALPRLGGGLELCRGPAPG